MAINSINPTTWKLITSFSALSHLQLDQKIENSWNAFLEYRRRPIWERARMKRAADILESEKDTFARLITTEMGKTFRAATEECAKCIYCGNCLPALATASDAQPR